MLQGLNLALEEFRQAFSWFFIHMVEARGCYYVSLYVLLFVFDSSVLSERYFFAAKDCIFKILCLYGYDDKFNWLWNLIWYLI